MFEKISPEQAGISSKVITAFIKRLEKRGAAMHSFLFMRGDKIFAEGYWKPFHRDFCHRQYSQTKSFVAVAIGLLEEEGKLCLDDKIVDYFPEKLNGDIQGYLQEQTIREMLTMRTVGRPSAWFVSGNPDRTNHYFNNARAMHPSGTIWAYDSAGTQVLCALVEKLAGKTLLDYLKEKLFNEMGVFQTASVLSTPNGDSWGDSAMICTLRDMAAFSRFVGNYGVWNGKRLMNEKYLREATDKLACNIDGMKYSSFRDGYGYKIWRVCGNGFSFTGMGDQLTVCYPEKDLIFACNADNQGTHLLRELIYMTLEETIVEKIKDEPLPQDESAWQELENLIAGLKLRSAQGAEDSSFREQLSGVEYVCQDNPMGIEKFSFVFESKDKGEFRYTNAQGEKTLPFGVNCNEFGQFPQFGYSNECGAVATTDGFTYKDAVSLAWVSERELLLFVQIIDKYFGNMSAHFYFKGDEVYAVFQKAAEYFLNEYQGVLLGQKRK